MKKFMTLLMLLCNLCLFADVNPIILHNGGAANDHFNFPVPADEPDVFYNNVSQTIIIDGGGEVNYYDVEIISWTTLDTVISAQVSGYYDTIDVSSLSEGGYTIFIYSPTGYTFDGDFEIY